MVLKRSVCGLNTGGRVSRRTISVIRRNGGFGSGVVQKLLEPPKGAQGSEAGDRVSLLRDASGTQFSSSNSVNNSNKSLDTLAFSDGGIQIIGDRLWLSGGWTINKEITWGVSPHYSLGRAKRWELFDRLYAAIEARKQNVRATISRESIGNNNATVPSNTNEPYLPYRVTARIRKPLPDDMILRRPRKRWDLVAALDSHGAQCTAIRPRRARAFANLTKVQMKSRTEFAIHIADSREDEGTNGRMSEGGENPNSEGEGDSVGTAGAENTVCRSGKARARRPDLVFSGSALPDSSRRENVGNEGNVSNSKRGRSSRAVHHNQHYRGVQRPAQWKAEKETHAKKKRNQKVASSNNSHEDKLPTITYVVTEPSPITSEEAFRLNRHYTRDHQWCFNRKDFSHRNARRRRETRIEGAFPFGNTRTRARYSSPFLEAPDRSTEVDEDDWLQVDVVRECEPESFQTTGTCIDPGAAQYVNACDPFHFPPLAVTGHAAAASESGAQAELSRAFRCRSRFSYFDPQRETDTESSDCTSSWSSIAPSQSPSTSTSTCWSTVSPVDIVESQTYTSQTRKDSSFAAFGWKTRVYFDPTLNPQANRAAPAESASNEVPTVSEQELDALVAAAPANLGICACDGQWDTVRVRRGALEEKRELMQELELESERLYVLAAQRQPKSAFSRSGSASPAYLLLLRMTPVLLDPHNQSEHVIICVRVKSARFEGGLSQLDANALQSLEQPLESLDSLCDCVNSALNTHFPVPAEQLTALSQQVGHLSPDVLVPKFWSHRDILLRYAGDPLSSEMRQTLGSCGQISFAEDIVNSSCMLESAMRGSRIVWKTNAECEICLDTSKGLQLSCGHNFCLRCLLHYLLLSAKNIRTTVLQCPAYKCTSELPDALSIALLTSTQWEQLHSKQTELAIAQRSCVHYCPNIRCGSLIHCASVCECREAKELSQRRPVNIVCDKCRYHFCLRCGKAAHWPAACGDAAAFESMLVSRADDLSNEDVSQVYLAHVKRCPSCHQPMEKNSGCQHMKCRCGFQFCWECLEPWETHMSGSWRCMTPSGKARFEIIQVRREKDRLLFFQNAYYRRALFFRKAYRCVASAKYDIESRFDLLHNLSTIKIHLIDSNSIRNLKLQITSALQLACDSFYLLQWYYSSVISKSRRRAVSYMRRFAAQMRTLEYAAVRLYRASGRLAFGDSFEALPFSMPILWSETGPDGDDWEDWDHSRQVALKWSARLECALRRQLTDLHFLSPADIQTVCQRLNVHNANSIANFERLTPGSLGLWPEERHVALLVERLEQFLLSRKVCQHQVKLSILSLLTQEFD